MDMRIDPTMIPQQSTVISPRQFMALRLLKMAGKELTLAIAREGEGNPAFEAEERESCHYCGAGLDAPGRPCPVCGMAPGKTADSTFDAVYDMGGQSLGSQYDDESNDPIMRVASASGRGEGLLHLLCASLPADDEEIAEYLIGSLDHHGYLPESIVEDTANALTRGTDEAARVLYALQRLDPPGVGARGARECLLIQLEALRAAGHAHPLAELLVREHLPAL